MKTFWLSFADDTGFLGVSVVDVDEDDAAMAAIEIAQRFPNAKPGAEWIAAANRKAWFLDCNPGGAVMAAEIPPAMAAMLPRNRALTPDEIVVFGERRKI